MVEGKERNVSWSNVMCLNGGVGCGSFFIRANNQDYHNKFHDLVQIRRRDGSFKIINADNSRELQRLTEFDVLSMQFDSCEAGESFYHKYASAIGFVVGEDHIRRNEHGEVVQKRWVCNSEEDFQQKKHLQNEFNCFATFCIRGDLVSHKWLVREFVATHTHHELSPTCKSHLQIDPPQNNSVEVKRKRKRLAVSLHTLPKLITPIATFQDQGILKASIMVEGKERNVSGSNVMGLNGGAGRGSFFIRANNQDYHNMFPDLVQTRTRDGSLKIINSDNSRALQRLTQIDVLYMQFDSCKAGESFYRKYASAIGFAVEEDYVRRNEHGEVVQKRWVCNSEEGFQQKKYLQNEFNCFAAFCIRLVNHKWYVTEFVAAHINHELSPTCKLHLQIDPPQKNVVNAKRKRLVNAQAPCKAEIPISDVEAAKRRILVNSLAPCKAEMETAKRKILVNALAPCKAEIPMSDMETAKRKILVNAQAPCKAEIPISDVEAAKRKILVNAQAPCKAEIPISDVEAAKRKILVIAQALCRAEIPISDVEAAKSLRLVNAQASCRAEIPIGDVEAALDFLSAKKDSDPGLFYATKFVEGHLTSLFWADSIYQLDSACFGEVMAVYSTKLCMMHFVVLTGLNHHHQTCVFGCALLQDETVEAYTWLFQTFLHVMQGAMPLSVVTDDHQAMREAIKLVLPRSRHRLCTRHLEKIARSIVNNPFFISDFKVCMLEVLPQDDFELKWKRMVEMYKVSENPWIQRMHRERHMWAETYLRGSFSAGLQSTRVCESIDKHLRKSSQNKLKLHEFLNEFEYAINALRREEGKAECKSTCVQYAVSNPLVKHAADVFSRESFKKFLSEMKLESHVLVLSKDEGTNHSKYRLCNPENENLVYEVMVKPSVPSIKCSCLKFETLGFPCCHAIHVLKSEGIEKIPQDLIHPRWTKSAKSSAQFWHRSLPPVSNDIMVKMARYGYLASRFSILCYLGSKSDKVRNLLLSGYHELEHEIPEQIWCI